MKLIAFDTECSRDYGNYCEVCSFGFAIANEHFEFETSKHTLVKASKPTGRLKKVKVDLEKLATAPDYKVVRRSISWLFDQPDAVYIAHSPENIFRQLCIMDKKYGIAPIKCKAYDVFTLLKNYANIPSYSLSGIAKTFGIKFDVNENNLRAKTCIRIIEYICREEKISLKQFIEICGKGAVVDSEIINYRVSLSFKQKRLERFYSARPTENMKFSGKVFSMSESFDNSSIEMGFRIAEYIVHNGGTLTKKASECNIFVWDGDINSKRLDSVHTVEGIQVISTSDLFLDEINPSDRSR